MKENNICNYADDNTIWKAGTNIENTVPNLESDINVLNGWFKHNSMLLNGNKCQFMIFEPKIKQDHN